MAADFDKLLSAVLVRELQGFSALLSCEKLTAGASQETYRISIETEVGEQNLALRRAVPTLQADSGVGTIGLDVEAQLLQLAAAAGIPEPGVLYLLQESDGLGAGFLMEWLEGETLGNRIVQSDELAELRPRLAYECGEVLARIHAMDWQAAGLDSTLPTVSPELLVQETWAYYRELEVPVPMIDYSWRWLLDNLPEQSRVSLVHGDFRNGNLMVTPAGISAVLDWELAQLGDPVRDLGWLCVNSWRFGERQLPVGGFGKIEDLLDGYNSVSSTEVSAGELHFWQVFGSFWWAMATLRMAQSWRTGETPSLERPVIGRRSSEAQMDCVNLLIPGDFDVPVTDTDLAHGTQLPMPVELLESVRGFLKQEVTAQLDPHTAFMSRVAANSLGIAQRELIHGPGLAAAEQARLGDLLCKSGTLDELRWDLVNALRDDLPLSTEGLAAHLRQTVAGQLAIDQPRYSALQGIDRENEGQ
jgi:aminoglycoside phosphotransferase (APT) family kinase protein